VLGFEGDWEGKRFCWGYLGGVVRVRGRDAGVWLSGNWGSWFGDKVNMCVTLSYYLLGLAVGISCWATCISWVLWHVRVA
jgi:hypothetical protein